MEEEVDNVTEQKKGRKKQNREEPTVLEEMKPLNLVDAEKP